MTEELKIFLQISVVLIICNTLPWVIALWDLWVKHIKEKGWIKGILWVLFKEKG